MNLGIYGYGNLGRAVEIVASDMSDVKISAVFSKRGGSAVRTLGAPVYAKEEAAEHKGEIDCMLLCGSSLSDTREDAMRLIKDFNTVDSFDIHASIPDYIGKLSPLVEENGRTAIISAGWDPGVFSLFRLIFSSAMPRAKVNTFWGRGVSQGHSAAIRRIDGVKRAVQYTVPSPEAIMLANHGKCLSERKRHRRECYVVAESGEEERIESEIKNMPKYFDGYDTDVYFIDEAEFLRDHASLYHRGECIAFNMSGIYGDHISRASLRLELDSNPEFTASVMIAYAIACKRLNDEGICGAYRVLDVAPSYLVRDGDKNNYI